MKPIDFVSSLILSSSEDFEWPIRCLNRFNHPPICVR